MSTIEVEHVEDDQFTVTTRGHTVVVDQPLGDGGGDRGPSPTELFVAGLAACVAHYARRYLTRHHLDPTGLRVEADFAFASDQPARVGTISLRLWAPPSLPPERREAFLAVASHCTVHNTLRVPPEVTTQLC